MMYREGYTVPSEDITWEGKKVTVTLPEHVWRRIIPDELGVHITVREIDPKRDRREHLTQAARNGAAVRLRNFSDLPEYTMLWDNIGQLLDANFETGKATVIFNWRDRQSYSPNAWSEGKGGSALLSVPLKDVEVL